LLPLACSISQAEALTVRIAGPPRVRHPGCGFPLQRRFRSLRDHRLHRLDIAGAVPALDDAAIQNSNGVVDEGLGVCFVVVGQRLTRLVEQVQNRRHRRISRNAHEQVSELLARKLRLNLFDPIDVTRSADAGASHCAAMDMDEPMATVAIENTIANRKFIPHVVIEQSAAQQPPGSRQGASG
jgi:hypothetical protein